jgi:putative transcriptional regulator
MSKRAFDKIAEGLNEVLAITRGEAVPAKLFVPKELDVKAIRTKVALSQDQFAAAFGFTASQIKDWEQGRTRPTGGLRAYLTLIDRDPAAIRAMLAG